MNSPGCFWAGEADGGTEGLDTTGAGRLAAGGSGIAWGALNIRVNSPGPVFSDGGCGEDTFGARAGGIDEAWG